MTKQGSLTVEQCKAKKKALEATLATCCIEFMEETGLQVTKVDWIESWFIAGFMDGNAHVADPIVRVTVEA